MKHPIQQIVTGPDILQKAEELYEHHASRLEKYMDLLLDWNEKINLVSRNVSRETLKQHIIHSLLPVHMGLLQRHNRWIDAGSGGGLPGIPLAICEKEKTWILNDNVRKKMRVVEDIIRSMKIDNCRVAPKSISLIDVRPGTGIVTKHAFKADDIIRLLGKKPWDTILMWKGAEGAMDEINAVKKEIDATLFRFDFGENKPFYKGKALLRITRQS